LPVAFPLPLPLPDGEPSRVEQYGPPGHLPFAPPEFLSALLCGCGLLGSPEVPAVPLLWWLDALPLFFLASPLPLVVADDELDDEDVGAAADCEEPSPFWSLPLPLSDLPLPELSLEPDVAPGSAEAEVPGSDLSGPFPLPLLANAGPLAPTLSTMTSSATTSISGRRCRR
jgi:hypothetical protein